MNGRGRGRSNGWCRRLAGSGFRMTVPRMAVMDAIQGLSGHPSAEDIYMKVHAEYPAVGLTTVYRTLDILERMGIVSKFDFGDGRARYERSEKSAGGSHHYHMICTHCGRVIDYGDAAEAERVFLDNVRKRISKKYGFKMTGYIMQFYGLCEGCKNVV